MSHSFYPTEKLYHNSLFTWFKQYCTISKPVQIYESTICLGSEVSTYLLPDGGKNQGREKLLRVEKIQNHAGSTLNSDR